MRHFLLPRPPAAHPGRVHTAATMARLVAPPGRGLCVAAPVGHNHRRSRSDRGRSNCTRSPGRGTRHTGTDGPRAGRPAPCRRHGVDERQRWQDSRPACVPGTVWGTAPRLNLQVVRGAVLAPKLWQALAAPSSRCMPSIAARTRAGQSPTAQRSPLKLGRHAPRPRRQVMLAAVYARFLTAADKRYWVERTFEDAKGQCGLGDYQVLGWRAWHHHVTMVMLAMLFIAEQRAVHQPGLELLTPRDIVEMLKETLPRKPEGRDALVARINLRHARRRGTIKSRYRPQQKTIPP